MNSLNTNEKDDNHKEDDDRSLSDLKMFTAVSLILGSYTVLLGGTDEKILKTYIFMYGDKR